jgi:RimJ/RimL family protein N-acetyltransferase
MEIQRLTEAHAEALWKLRLRALETEPASFAESPEEHARMSLPAYAERLRSGGDENFVLGAIVEGELVGMVGFARETRIKRRHRGMIWGMYVTPPWRGKSVGRELLGEAIRLAKQLPGLSRIQLSVSETTPGAQRLYEKLGFQPFGLEPQALMVNGRCFDEIHLGITIQRAES